MEFHIIKLVFFPTRLFLWVTIRQPCCQILHNESFKSVKYVSPEILTSLRTKNSLNSGSLSEMASRTIGLVSSPVLKLMEPDVLVNSWFSSRGVTESLANSCQKTVTLPKCPRDRRILGQ